VERVIGEAPGIEIEGNRLSIERCTIMEGDTLPELGRPHRQILIGREFCGQAWHRVRGRPVKGHQRLAALVEHSEGHAVGHHRRVELHRVGVRAPDEGDRLLRLQRANNSDHQ